MADIYTNKTKEEEKEEKEGVTSAPETKKINIEALSLPIARPIGIRFDIQDPTEDVILLLRRHWFTNIHWILLSVLLLVAPVIFKFFPLFNFFPGRFQFMGLIIWYLLVTAFIFEEFLSWYFNVFIVTDQRIIDFDFYNLLNKDVSVAELEKIQDTSEKVGGIAGVMFNYGDILIQTAGAIPEIQFEDVPNPNEVAKIIHTLKDKITGSPEAI
jgi:hypothetical protein